MLAEELSIIDVDSPLWSAARSLLAVALQLEQNGDTYVWHGWNKVQIEAFLKTLPLHCSLVVGVWETSESENGSQDREVLVMGVVCEVRDEQIQTLRTFGALSAASLPPLEELEPGFEHAREIIRAVKVEVAPVAWAMFTDKTTWDEWLLTTADDGGVVDKGQLLTAFARQGRCVFMGSEATHHHHP